VIGWKILKETCLGRGSCMNKSQVWTRRSLSDEEKDGMTIGSTLLFVEGKAMKKMVNAYDEVMMKRMKFMT